jgi:hypothetical protein
MFQGMRTHVASTCCTNHNSQTFIYETSSTENVAYTCFKQQMHEKMNNAYAYEMKMQLVGAKRLGCYRDAPPTGDGGAKRWQWSH